MRPIRKQREAVNRAYRSLADCDFVDLNKKSVKMLKLLSLRDFESPSFDELATAGFIDDAPLYCTANEMDKESQPHFNHLRDLPAICITLDMLATREMHRTIGARDLFLPVHDSALKKIVSVWRDKGVLEAIRTAAAESPTEITIPVHWLATRFCQMLDVIERGSFWSSVLPPTGSGSIVDVVSTRDWMTALVRCIAWHPHCIRIAVATRDDRIRIFSTGNIGTATLRHSGQKSVCSMSWRPHAGRELAAACQNGVLIWTVELGAASNSLSHAFMLKYKNHTPVTNVSWSPQGDVLVSCSLTDVNMIIWDVSKESGVPLRRVGGGGICLIRWSSCGSRLLATTCRKVFRVWNTGVGTPWTSERWRVPNGRVAAACFGPNLTLLFTSTEDPAMLFSLPLRERIFNDKKMNTFNDSKLAEPMIDLSKVTFHSEEDDSQCTVGGRVVSMDWDSTGCYLAIIFEDSPVVALFKTKIGSTSTITEVKPLCLLKGFVGEYPSCIQFYPNHHQNNNVSILTVAWSSGSVRHFPIVKNLNAENPASTCKTAAILSDTFTHDDDHQSFYSSFI